MAWDNDPPESDESWEASEALFSGNRDALRQHEHKYSSEVGIIYRDEDRVTILFCACGEWIEVPQGE